MKKTTLAILFTILLSCSCIFYSCNSNQSIFGSPNESETSDGLRYEEMIRALEDQIIELKQNQYISDAEKNKELLRLEGLISELKQSAGIGATDTDSSDESADTEGSTDAETEEAVSRFIYSVSDGAATITGYEGDEKSIVIPSSIDGYQVTAIADDAFNSQAVTDITVPNGVTKIGWFAFKSCDSLRTVTLPASVTSIGYSAFPQATDRFTLLCPADSFAQKYAESHGVSYTLI